MLTRIHQEDLCQAMGLSHELKYQADGGPGLKACFDLVRAYSANPIKDLQQLIEWVFFNFLIGNMDAHAKNLSFMYQGRQHQGDSLVDDVIATIKKRVDKTLHNSNKFSTRNMLRTSRRCLKLNI